MLAGKSIDLRTAPNGVTWVQLQGEPDDYARSINAAKTTGDSADRVLVIGDSRNPSSRHSLASSVQGAVVVEPVDLRDMVSFLSALNLAADNLLDQVVEFAEEVMTNVGRVDLLRRVGTLTQGRARKGPSKVENAALFLLRERSLNAVIALLTDLAHEAGVRTFRPAVLRGCIEALRLAIGTEAPSIRKAAIQVREQNRLLGRPLPKRAIGSTLLLKGSEAESVVILNADDLDARNLYVALTRASKAIVVCSRSPVLGPLS